jgi:hypothetical protein
MPFRSAHFTSGSRVRHEYPYISCRDWTIDELRGTRPEDMSDDDFLRLMVDSYYRYNYPGSLLEFTGMLPEEFGEWYLHRTIPERVMRVARRRGPG